MCRGGGHLVPQNTLGVFSDSSPFQAPSLHCPVRLLSPVPTYGAAQAMEVCVRVALWWCRKDPAHEGGAWKAFARVSVPSHDLVLCTSSV